MYLHEDKEIIIFQTIMLHMIKQMRKLAKMIKKVT